MEWNQLTDQAHRELIATELRGIARSICYADTPQQTDPTSCGLYALACAIAWKHSDPADAGDGRTQKFLVQGRREAHDLTSPACLECAPGPSGYVLTCSEKTRGNLVSMNCKERERDEHESVNAFRQPFYPPRLYVSQPCPYSPYSPKNRDLSRYLVIL